MRFAGSLPSHLYARIPTQSGGVSPEPGRPPRLPPCYTPLSPTEFPKATPHDARTPRPTEGSHRAHVFNWSPYSHPIASIRERGGQSIPALPSTTDRAGYAPAVRVRHRSLLRRIAPPSLLGSLLPSPLTGSDAERLPSRRAPPNSGAPGEEGWVPFVSRAARRIVKDRLISRSCPSSPRGATPGIRTPRGPVSECSRAIAR